MKKRHDDVATDPLVVPLTDAPLTVEYLIWLQQEASMQTKRSDPMRYFALADRGVVIARKMNAPEQLTDFLLKRSWCYRTIERDLALALSDLHEMESLLGHLPPERSEWCQMRGNAAHARILKRSGDYLGARSHLLAGMELARLRGDALWQTRFCSDLGVLHYESLGDLEGGVAYLAEALRHAPDDDDRNTELYNLAGLAQFCGDTATARTYLDEALAIDTASANQRAARFSLASVLFLEEGNLDEALSWSDRAVETARRATDPELLWQALDIRGDVRFRQGDLLASIHDLNEALTLDIPDHHSCKTQFRLAKCYAALAASEGEAKPADRSDIEPAARVKEPLDAAERYVPSLPAIERVGALMLQAETRKLLGDFQGALQSMEEKIALERSLSIANVRNQIGSLRLLMKLEREEHEREIQRMKAAQTEKELSNTTLQLLAQTELLRDLRSDLQKIIRKIPPTEPTARELRERIKRLPCDAVDWKKFDAQFAAVHPEFIRNLTQHAPDLTATEVRICTMLRMNLKSHEIAGIFCITEAGVEFHRKNIRRKLGLTKEEKLPIVLGGM